MRDFESVADWDERVDFVVIGSGAAGLSAAITATHDGASVAVLEKASTIGGTTAVSGGVYWVPGHPHMESIGVADDRHAARRYILRNAGGRGDEDLIDCYLDRAPGLVTFLEEVADVEFQPMRLYPDYHPEFEGGCTGGRSLDNPLFDTNELGEWKSRLRRNPVNGRMPIRIEEAITWGVFSKPFGFPVADVIARSKAGYVHGGAALIGRLLKALLARGVEPRTESPASDLVVDSEGRVRGVVANAPEGQVAIEARHGVLLASGGFEWDDALRARFLGGRVERSASPPSCTGDGLRMAMELGADLGNMSEAWWCPMVDIPGETYDGAPLHRAEFGARCLPHSIIVNRRGRRFVDEAHNYNDMTKAFFAFDAYECAERNIPAWLIADSQYLRKYIFVATMPGRDVPEFVTQAPTLRELAQNLGVDADGLEDEVARFNGFAETGVDPDFGRGESAFDRLYGDPDCKPNPNLGALSEGPFFAIAIHPGTIGTKGGPRTDTDGRVLHAGGGVIPGLYAAGNAMAGLSGSGYPGAGITIGAALLFGHLAARHACGTA